MIPGNTIWVWLLAAAAIPVAVHLWNRKSGEPQLLGTFRFLPDQSFAKARRIELHEIPLLILRILLICLLTMLLTDLLILNEQPKTESIVITETNSLQRQMQNQGGTLEIEVPSADIEKAGWWNIIEQADADYQPNIIHANGRFTQNFFKGNRPSVGSDVTWENNRSETETISAVWQSGTDHYSAFIQHKDSAGIQHSVQQITTPEIVNNSQAIIQDDTVAYAGAIRLVINSETPEQLQNGLEYAAEYWNAEIEYTGQSSQNLFSVMAGDQQFVLQKEENPDGFNDVIEGGAQTGIEIEISGLDTISVSPKHTLLETSKMHIPVLWFSDDQTFHVNGTVSDDMTAWFYAGVGHKLIQHSLGIVQFLMPEMPENQRRVRQTQHQTAGIAGRESMRIWLILFLLIVWSAERFLAPGRGM